MSEETKYITGADLLVQELVNIGTEYVFGYPGGAVIPLFDALYKANPPFKNILCRHEQGLAHAAEGYARVSGKPGVVIATSGPGATNLLTGIANAMMDSLPLIVITGQVGAGVIGTDAFQEADVMGLTTPITKQNYQINDARQLPRVIGEAYHIATTGRKGPVVIDLPKNVEEQLIDPNEELSREFSLPGYQPTITPNKQQIERLAGEIEESQKPLLLIGAGIDFAGASDELIEFVHRSQIPVVSTLHGMGSFPESNDLALGMGGMHGTYAANKALNETDLLINIGSRFDDRLTGDVDSFAPEAKIVHIDIDPAEIGKIIETDLPIVGDAKEAIQMLLDMDINYPDISAWTDEVKSYKKDYPLWIPESKNGELSPQYLIKSVSDQAPDNTVVVTDVGQHQMWAAQFFEYNKPKGIVCSGGLGTMGFGLPASVGAQLADLDNTVVLFAGDGGIQMTIQELAVLKTYNLPVKVFIVNNSSLGMVRQWQSLFYEERLSQTVFEEGDNPDFMKIADAYGIKGIRIKSLEEADEKVKEALEYDGPVIVDAWVPGDAKVYPMIPAGKSFEDMIGAEPICEE